MKQDSLLKNKFALALVVFLTVLAIARLLLLNQYPLIGTTEPRYAELARKMLLTGDWVTLWVSDGVPLWGKPPLLFWLDAISMSALGINEFALRLPTFIASLLILVLFWCWPAKTTQSPQKNRLFALITCLVYFSTPFGFFAAGFVATDIFLTLGLTLSMLGFWNAIQPPTTKSWQRIWPWTFFVGMAIGLLAKGPLALVLLGLALFVWMLWSPKARFLLIWKSLPWIRGLLLMAALAFPWYILHEIRTPGFLNHFIIGEHFERFFVKDWAGGRFAPSHGEPLGMIWWFAVEAFMPWLLLIIPAIYMVIKRPSGVRPITQISHETQYLLGWIAAPLLLFTPSRNILEAYMLTALPAFAILTGRLWLDLIDRNIKWQRGIYLAIPAPLVVVVAVIFFNPILDEQSQKHILQNWQTGTPIVYIGKVPPSAVFYTRDQATDSPSFSAFEAAYLAKPSPKPTTVVMHYTEFDTMNTVQKQQWKLVEAYGDYIMLRK